MEFTEYVELLKCSQGVVNFYDIIRIINFFNVSFYLLVTVQHLEIINNYFFGNVILVKVPSFRVRW